MRDEFASRDHAVARIAARQHGVVTSRQLGAAGIDRDALGRRVRAGRLHRLHRGVYAVGHFALPLDARWMAAVLACGERAILSHRSAAALWGMIDPRPGPVEVPIPGLGGRPRRAGIRARRSSALTPDQTTRRRGIPVTTPARTIADLRRTAAPTLVRRALREAAVLGVDIPEGSEADLTRSELEHRFLVLCRRHRIPPPESNAKVGEYCVDFLWPHRKLIVETDGYRFHRGHEAFEGDRARDVDLRLLGYEVLRFTYSQVTDNPRSVAAAVRKLLHVRSEAT